MTGLGLIHNIRHVSVPSPLRIRSVRLACIHTIRHVSVLSPLHIRSVRFACIHTVRHVSVPSPLRIRSVRLACIHTVRHVSVPSPLHIRSVRLACIHTVRRAHSPSGTAGDRRPAIISIKYWAPFVFSETINSNSIRVRWRRQKAALSGKKRRLWVHNCFRSRKSEGSYGRNSDGGIFVHSKLEKCLETHLGIPED